MHIFAEKFGDDEALNRFRRKTLSHMILQNEILANWMGICTHLINLLANNSDAKNKIIKFLTLYFNALYNMCDSSAKLSLSISKLPNFWPSSKKLFGIIDDLRSDSADRHLNELQEGLLGLIYNMVIHNISEIISAINEHEIVNEVHKIYVKSASADKKITSLVLLAYAVDEKDFKLYQIDDESAEFLISLLHTNLIKEAKIKNASVADETVQLPGGITYNTFELARGLEKLSTSDANKSILLEKNLLDEIESGMLAPHTSLELKRIAMSMLYNFCFDEKLAQTIKSRFDQQITEYGEQVKLMKSGGKPFNLRDLQCWSNLDYHIASYYPMDEDRFMGLVLDPFESVKNEKNQTDNAQEKVDRPNLSIPPDTKTNLALKELEEKAQIFTDLYQLPISGMLWLFHRQDKTIEKPKSNSTSSASTQPVVMISYSHHQKSLITRIAQRLIKHGIRIWVDFMEINKYVDLMDAMAAAVEQADIVLVCTSRSYKQSANCRSEAQYARDCGKTIIPLLVEEKYRSDGWLGILIAGLFYFDFCQDFDSTFERLLVTINQSINEKKGVDVPDTTAAEIPIKPKINTEVGSHQNFFSTERLPATLQSQIQFSQETIDRISGWSSAQLTEHFSDYNKSAEPALPVNQNLWPKDHDGRDLAFLLTLHNASHQAFFQTILQFIKPKSLSGFRNFYERLLALQKVDANDFTTK